MDNSHNKSQIPAFLTPFLWSYDLSKMDIEKNKKRIITNVLNYGTKKATDWLFGFFGEKDIKETLENPLPGEWNKKSLNFWSLILNVKARKLETIKRII